MDAKYMILDFGGIIALPITGDWNITPKFKELIDMNKLDMEKWQKSADKFDSILSTDIDTIEEEEEMFFHFYEATLQDAEYPLYDEKIAREIARNRTYEDDKYFVCKDIYKELEELQKKYVLLMLTDNWPCVFDYLKRINIDKYFEKVYVSSVYRCLKKDKVFFDYPINDYNIKEGEAIFVDDNEENLDVAVEKKFKVYRMDRLGTVKSSKYPIIHDLFF